MMKPSMVHTMQINTLILTIHDLHKERESLVRKLHEANAKLREAQSALMESEERANILDADSDALLADIEDLKTRLKTAEEDATRYQRVLGDTRHELGVANLRAQDAESRAANLFGENGALKEQLVGFEKDLEKLVNQARADTHTIRKYHEIVQDEQAISGKRLIDYQASQESLGIANERIAQLEKDLASERAKSHALLQKATNANGEIAQKIQTLEADIVASQKRMDQAKLEIMGGQPLTLDVVAQSIACGELVNDLTPSKGLSVVGIALGVNEDASPMMIARLTQATWEIVGVSDLTGFFTGPSLRDAWAAYIKWRE